MCWVVRRGCTPPSPDRSCRCRSSSAWQSNGRGGVRQFQVGRSQEKGGAATTVPTPCKGCGKEAWQAGEEAPKAGQLQADTQQAGRCEAAHHEAFLQVVSRQAKLLQLPPDFISAHMCGAECAYRLSGHHCDKIQLRAAAALQSCCGNGDSNAIENQRRSQRT